MPALDIRFCRLCGAPSSPIVPLDDNRERAVCTRCGFVDYVNPVNVVGTIPVWEGEADGPRILLCRRAIEPRRGYWTLPAGFMEVGETIREGAARETAEEAGAHIEMGELYAVYDVVHAAQVHLFHRARLLDLELAPGPETLETTLVRIDEIPWNELSFRTVEAALRDWVADHERGEFTMHAAQIA